MHNEIKAGQRKNRYGFWYGWTIMGSILERKKGRGNGGSGGTDGNEGMPLFGPRPHRFNSAMLEARPHFSYQLASGLRHSLGRANRVFRRGGSVRIRHSACSHQPSSFVPNPALLAFILGRMHTNAILSVAVRRTAMGAVEPALGQLIGRYHTILGQTPARLGPRTKIAERLCWMRSVLIIESVR